MALKETALHYRNNHKLLPIPCMGEGDSKGKIPLIKWKELQQLPTPSQIEYWFNKFSNANLGFKTGSVSGILVLDNDGVEVTESMPITPISTSRPGHYHYYFKNPDFFVPSSVSEVGERLDIRCDGGFIVAPPSKHFDKKTGVQDGEYTWLDGLSPDNVSFAECPSWLITKLKETINSEPVDISGWVGSEEGSRDKRLYKVACSLLARGEKTECVFDILIGLNATFKSPLGSKIVSEKFESAYTFILKQRRKNGRRF